jgi:hypothetical protein
MINKFNINPCRRNLIVYIVLTAVILAVYWQVNQYDFVNIDDNIYVTDNSHVKLGISWEGLRWAFSTTYAEFWHPLTWLSLMLDYQFHGLHPGGYHLTNLILHILSTLLLFSLFNRMTGAVWKSAFAAVFFALHPLRVESVAWISERKDVLGVFFWMLTLLMYVRYTEKPVLKRYLTVLFCFICALMSKPIVVTLPVIIILLDYWPLCRFESRKGHFISWQLREKIPFFVLSALFSIITLYAQYKPMKIDIPFNFRIMNSIICFVTYLGKTFWPDNLFIFYPLPLHHSLPLVLGSAALIFIITAISVILVKRSPYLFVGWLWYAITIMPVLGIIQIGIHWRHDLYTYLPSVGIAIIVAWGIPSLINRDRMCGMGLIASAIVFLIIMAVLSWRQCGYWKNTGTLFDESLKVTRESYVYNNRGIYYGQSGRYELAIEDFNRAISLNNKYAIGYNNRGFAYAKIGRYQNAIEDFSQAIRLKPDYAKAYNNRAIINLNQNKIAPDCYDAQKACELGDCSVLNEAKSKGHCR